jgi:hypothetical protein
MKKLLVMHKSSGQKELPYLRHPIIEVMPLGALSGNRSQPYSGHDKGAMNRLAAESSFFAFDARTTH